jgi:hypothetical protein
MVNNPNKKRYFEKISKLNEEKLKISNFEKTKPSSLH